MNKDEANILFKAYLNQNNFSFREWNSLNGNKYLCIYKKRFFINYKIMSICETEENEILIKGFGYPVSANSILKQYNSMFKKNIEVEFLSDEPYLL